jgi:hypothetical protein
MDNPKATPLAVIPLRSQDISILFDCYLTGSIVHCHATTCQPIVGKCNVRSYATTSRRLTASMKSFSTCITAASTAGSEFCCRHLGVAVR